MRSLRSDPDAYAYAYANAYANALAEPFVDSFKTELITAASEERAVNRSSPAEGVSTDSRGGDLDRGGRFGSRDVSDGSRRKRERRCQRTLPERIGALRLNPQMVQ